MRTDDLVAMLARNVEPVDPGVAARRFAVAVVGGLIGAAALLLPMLGLNPALQAYTSLPMFWVRGGFAAMLATAGVVAALRLARPGATLARVPAALAAPLVLMWALAAWTLLGAAPGERPGLVLGRTWASCPFNIAVLSVPAFVGVFWAMKGLAPTRLRLAGAGAGLAAGAVGAVVYTLHCPELAAPFLGLWYVLGMLIPTAVGALVGPRLLRW